MMTNQIIFNKNRVNYLAIQYLNLYLIFMIIHPGMENKAEYETKKCLPKLLTKQQHLRISQQTPRDISPSPMLDEYQAKMKQIPLPDIQTLISPTCSQSLRYHPKSFYPSLVIQAYSQNPQIKILELKAHLSYFTLRLFVYFHDEPVFTNRYLSTLGRGSFGTVYKLNQNVAIKHIFFSQEGNNQYKIIRDSLKEYILCYIASALYIGPRLTKNFGVDLIVYQNCIQFCMENCKNPKGNNLAENQSLLSSLKLMHHLNIIHGDIKHQNIMYSDSYQKNVFIDFNISTVIQEKIGIRTLTEYFGTFEFSSPEMKDVWKQKKPGYVDLYYNDLYGLKKLQKYNLQIGDMNLKKQKHRLYEIEMVNSFFKHIQLRLLIFKGHYHQISKFLIKHEGDLRPSFILKKQLKKKPNPENIEYLSQFHQIESNFDAFINQTLLFLQYRQDRIINYQQIRKKIGHKSNPQKLQQTIKSIKSKERLTLEENSTQIKEIELGIVQSIFSDSEIFWKKSENNCKKLWIKLQSQQNSLTQISQLYYQFLGYYPSDQLLTQVVSHVFAKIGLDSKEPILTKMLQIDKHFRKGKTVKKQMWRLGQFQKRRIQNFIGQLILQISLIHEISECFLALFEKGFHLNFTLYFKYFERRRKGNSRGMNLFEEVVTLNLIRVLKNTVTKTNKKIQKIRTLFQTYSKLLTQREHHLLYQFSQITQKVFMSLTQRQQTLSRSEISDKIATQKLRILLFKDFSLIEKYNNQQFYCEELSKIKQSPFSSRESIKIYDFLQKAFIYEADYLYNTIIILMGRLDFDKRKEQRQFLAYVLKATQQYFCSVYLNDICQINIKKTVKRFNTLYLQLKIMFDQCATQKCQQLLQQLKLWVSGQTLLKEDQLFLKSQIFKMSYMFESQTLAQVRKYVSEQCLFTLLNNDDELFQFLQVLEEKFKFELLDPKQETKIDTESEVVIDRAIERGYSFYVEVFIHCSLFMSGDFDRFLRFWDKLSKGTTKGQQRQFDGLIFVGQFYHFLDRSLFHLRQGINRKTQNFIIFYKRMLQKWEDYSSNLAMLYIEFTKWILVLWKQMEMKKKKIERVCELSILVILKCQQRCPLTIKNRLSQQIGFLLQSLNKMEKLSLSSKLLRDMRKSRVRLYMLRHSYYKSKQKFLKDMEKALRKIKGLKKRVGEKLEKYWSNRNIRIKTYQIMPCRRSLEEFFEYYLNDYCRI